MVENLEIKINPLGHHPEMTTTNTCCIYPASVVPSVFSF